MADYEALLNAEKKKHVSSLASPSPEGKSIQEKTQQSRDQLTNRLTNQSTEQSTKQSIVQLTQKSTTQSANKIVDKPKGFYITERLNKRLDEAVDYFQEVHGIKKADRSTVVNAILDNEANWTEESLDLLVDRVISLLTSRLMG